MTRALDPQALATVDRTGEVGVQIGGRPFRIRRQFLHDVNEQHLADAIRGLHRALLVLHAPRDEVVDIDNARRIFETAKHPKSFVSLDDADHLLTRPADGAYAAAVLAAWAGRYLGTPGPEPAPPPDDRREGTVVVAEAAHGRLAQVIRAGRHTWTAGEPPGVGDDSGPTPYDLLLGALGACTSMTLRLYADRKGWPLEHVSVTLTHERSHADDSRDCEVEPCLVDRFERRIELEGTLSDEQRRALMAIAEKCPVHRTLLGDKQIVTTLAAAT